MSVLLINRSSQTVVLHLEKVKALGGHLHPKLRGRETLIIPRGVELDLCKDLNLSVSEVEKVLAASPEVAHFTGPSSDHKLQLIYPESPPEPEAPHIPFTAQDEAKVQEGLKAQKDYVLQKAEFEQEDEHINEKVVSAHTAQGEGEEPEASAVATSGLDAMRATVADNIPSARWDRTKLAEHAKAQGIDVPDSMSKNQILRRLRGL